MKQTRFVVMRHGNDRYLETLMDPIEEVLDESNQHYDATHIRDAIDAIKGLVNGEDITVTHSDTWRAEITAKIIAKGIGYEGEFTVDDRLQDSVPYSRMSEMFMNEVGGLHIIVSHKPPVEQILRECTGRLIQHNVQQADAYLVEITETGLLVEKLN